MEGGGGRVLADLSSLVLAARRRAAPVDRSSQESVGKRPSR